MNCYFYTFGCKVNTCETAGMQSLLQNAGYTVVSQPEQADIFLFNSCTVTASGDSRLHHAMRKVRREHPDALLVLTGCYPQAYPEQAAAIPEADLIIGTKHRSRLPALLAQLCQNHARIAAVDSYARQDDFEVLPCDTMPDNTRAFLKIQDGCNCFCSYCIIPYARGRCRSLSLKDVAAGAAAFAKNGYREIVLCGINLGFYGMEWGGSLAEAVECCARTAGVERVRLGSLEPERLTEEQLSRLAALPQFCPQFHLSLQSGCDETLRRMNRHYTSQDYLQRVELLRKYFDHPAVTTDIIVGFPGETQEEFETTCAFAKEVGFAQIHVFKYSRRQGTVADAMTDQVDEQIKGKRSDALLAIEAQLEKAYHDRFMGQTEKVLVEEAVMLGKEKYLIGYNERYVRVAVPYEAGKCDESLCNRLIVRNNCKNLKSRL